MVYKKIIFKGETLDHFTQNEAIQNLALIFKLPTDKIEKLFTGEKVTLKKLVSVDNIPQYTQAFMKCGIKVYIEDTDEIILPKKTSNLQLVPLKEDEENHQHSPVTIKTTNDTSTKTAQQDHQTHQNLNQVILNKQATLPRHHEEPLDATPALFSSNFDERIGRIAYFNHIITLYIIFTISMLILLRLSGSLLLSIIIPLSLLLFFSVRLVILRLHDINLSAWWALLIFLLGLIPALGIYIQAICSLLLSIIPGSSSLNNYGAPTKQGSWILAITYAIIFSLLILIPTL